VKIKRKIKGKTAEYSVYTKQEAAEKKITPVYWKQAQTGDWALTDDNYVSECYDRKDYTDKNGKTKTFIKLTCGVGWDTQFSKINYELNRTYGVYSKTNPKRSYDVQENNTTRARNTVTSYAQMVVNAGKVDYQALGQIYRPDQKSPAATVRRFLKQKVSRKMVEKKLKELLVEKKVNKEFALNNLMVALKMSEEKGDVNNFLKANDYIMDLLEMKPSKKMVTDTIQVDMTKQIAETIAKEDKRVLVQRKTEENELVE
jgi:vacuolar-type H+-ATPase subunit I/STV1